MYLDHYHCGECKHGTVGPCDLCEAEYEKICARRRKRRAESNSFINYVSTKDINLAVGLARSMTFNGTIVIPEWLEQRVNELFREYEETISRERL